jgi:hypothetical protein
MLLSGGSSCASVVSTCIGISQFNGGKDKLAQQRATHLQHTNTDQKEQQHRQSCILLKKNKTKLTIPFYMCFISLTYKKQSSNYNKETSRMKRKNKRKHIYAPHRSLINAVRTTVMKTVA